MAVGLRRLVVLPAVTLEVVVVSVCVCASEHEVDGRPVVGMGGSGNGGSGNGGIVASLDPVAVVVVVVVVIVVVPVLRQFLLHRSRFVDVGESGVEVGRGPGDGRVTVVPRLGS